jgi:hypothetical protein
VPGPPAIPERRPATFLIEVTDAAGLRRVGAALQAYTEAFEEGDDAHLVVWVANPGDVDQVREVVRQVTATARASGPGIQVLTEGDSEVEVIRARTVDASSYSVGAFRRPYVRHRELDELLARMPALYEELSCAAEGHPRAAEVGPLLESFIEGYVAYARSGDTPLPSHLAMRKLFVITNGAFNRAMREIHEVVHPPYQIQSTEGVLASEADELRTAREHIETDGFHIFSTRLPEPLVDELEAYARHTPLLPQPADPGMKEVLYDEARPIAPAYYLQPPRVLSSPVLRRLCADTSLLDLAQAVLRCQPVLSHLGMWWSTPAGGKAVSEIAQLYHFDMDKLAFIQFFVYLTDVSNENGPHTFVRGSHRHKPMPLRRDGRIPDREIRRHYAADDIVEICGPRGTIFAVDTTAFHKGKPVTAGHRLVVQWVYASSLFGAPHAMLPLNGAVEPEFLESLRSHPHLFERVVSSSYDLDSPRVGRSAARS